MKMKKLVALVTASALCLGMSMTVLADYSIKDDYVPRNTPDVSSTSPDADYGVAVGDVVEGIISEVEQKFINDYRKANPNAKDVTDEEILGIFELDGTTMGQINEKINEVLNVFQNDGDSNQRRLDLFKENGYIVPEEDVKAIVLSTANLTPMWERGEEMSDKEFKDKFPNGMTQEINVGNALAKGLSKGDTIYVLHYDVEKGSYEYIPGTVETKGGDAFITVTFKSLSPIGIVKVMSNGDVIALNKAGEPITDGNGNIPVLNNPNKADGSKTDASKTDSSKTNNAKNITATILGKSPKTGEF